MLRIAAIVLALCALPAVAAAERGSNPNYCGQEEECTEYFMNDENVDGDVETGGFDVVTGGRHIRHVPLIRTRSHFIDLMMKSAENL